MNLDNKQFNIQINQLQSRSIDYLNENVELLSEELHIK